MLQSFSHVSLSLTQYIMGAMLASDTKRDILCFLSELCGLVAALGLNGIESSIQHSHLLRQE